jgi:hypothetical protein
VKHISDCRSSSFKGLMKQNTFKFDMFFQPDIKTKTKIQLNYRDASAYRLEMMSLINKNRIGINDCKKKNKW